MNNRQLGLEKIYIFKDTGFNIDIVVNVVEVNFNMSTLQETK